MEDVMLRADCAQCAALCCVALAFDRSALFAFDKPAGVACRHVDACNACAIHEDLAAQGFAGCAQFDCLGAGQRVIRMFAGQSWRDNAQTAREMFDAFHVMRRAHEQMLLLREALRYRLSPQQRAECAALIALLQAESSTPQALASFERGDTPNQVRAFLASLRACVRD